MQVITRCSVIEIRATKDSAPLDMAKTCELRRCGHYPDSISSRECLTSCLNIDGENKHRYILATQDEELRAKMRHLPGVPMVYIRRAVMIMEPPSAASLERKEAWEQSKLGGLEPTTKRKRDEEEENKPKKRRKGPKAPNPLSVKKKQRKPIPGPLANPKDTSQKDGNDATHENIIGGVSEGLRRAKSKRKRKHHKNSDSGTAGRANANIELAEGREP